MIRTLMERSALYRRRLAPLMMLGAAGAIGGGLVGSLLKLASAREFVLLWGGIAVLVLLGAGWVTRGQAIRAGEVFWTAPTRRIFAAFLPVLLVGGALGGTCLVGPASEAAGSRILLIVSWSILFGLGLHSAGFCVAKGVRRLGWAFVLAGSALGVYVLNRGVDGIPVSPSLLMAAIFGGLHLVSAVYLFFTEAKDEAS